MGDTDTGIAFSWERVREKKGQTRLINENPTQKKAPKSNARILYQALLRAHPRKGPRVRNPDGCIGFALQQKAPYYSRGTKHAINGVSSPKAIALRPRLHKMVVAPYWSHHEAKTVGRVG